MGSRCTGPSSPVAHTINAALPVGLRQASSLGSGRALTAGPPSAARRDASRARSSAADAAYRPTTSRVRQPAGMGATKAPGAGLSHGATESAGGSSKVPARFVPPSTGIE